MIKSIIYTLNYKSVKENVYIKIFNKVYRNTLPENHSTNFYKRRDTGIYRRCLRTFLNFKSVRQEIRST